MDFTLLAIIIFRQLYGPCGQIPRLVIIFIVIRGDVLATAHACEPSTRFQSYGRQTILTSTINSSPSPYIVPAKSSKSTEWGARKPVQSAHLRGSEGLE